MEGDGPATSRDDPKSKDSIDDEVMAIHGRDAMASSSYDKQRASTISYNDKKKKDTGGVNIKYKFNHKSPSNQVGFNSTQKSADPESIADSNYEDEFDSISVSKSGIIGGKQF